MSDDELDGLLDEALDTFDHQEQQRKEQREQAAQQQAQSADASGLDPAILSSLMNVFSQLGQSDGTAEPDLTKLHSHVEEIIGTLQGDPDTTDEEKARLNSAAEFLRAGAAAPDQQMSEEQVEEMRKMLSDFGSGVPPEGLGDDAQLDDLLKTFGDMQTEATMRQQQAAAPDAAPSPGPPPPPADATEPGVPAVMQALLQHPEAILGPFKAMRDAYPKYLEENKDSIAPADADRYQQQLHLVEQICDVVGDGTLFKEAADQSEQKDGTAPENVQLLDRFTSLVEKLQDLGEPPQLSV